MDYTTLLSEIKEGQDQLAKGMQSLYEACQQIADGRRARGKRYDLAGLLVVLVLAKLAGMKSLLGASDWTKDQKQLLRQGLQLSWKRMPCANTYSYGASASGQSIGECRPGGMVGAQGGRKPLRRGTEPFCGTAKRAACPCGRGRQSVERHWQASLWRRGPAEAGAACV